MFISATTIAQSLERPVGLSTHQAPRGVRAGGSHEPPRSVQLARIDDGQPRAEANLEGTGRSVDIAIEGVGVAVLFRLDLDVCRGGTECAYRGDAPPGVDRP